MKIYKNASNIILFILSILTLILAILSLLNIISIDIVMLLLGLSQLFTGINQIITKNTAQADEDAKTAVRKHTGIFPIVLGSFLIIAVLIKLVMKITV